MSKNSNIKSLEITSTLARSTDGTIQITFSIPHEIIEKTKLSVLKDISKTVEIPGFRKGMAPISKVEEKVSSKIIYEKILNQIIPSEISKAFNKFKLKPAVYPRLELLSNKDGEDWQVRITTCELPDVELGNYKDAIINASKTNAIWTPSQNESKDNKNKELTSEEKENIAVKSIIDSTKINIPKPLIEEDVNTRLSKLLEQIEKLGLSIDNYLSSIGKTPDALRKEYESQSKDSLTVELSLNKIAEKENIKIPQEEIDRVITATSNADTSMKDKLNTPQQRKTIELILKRREALNRLVKLIP